MSRVTLFADIILPLAIPNTYTYRVPYELNEHLKTGQRAIVQLGKTKLYTGIVHRIHENPPKKYEAKYLEALLDEHPIVTETQLKLWEWIASYYCCCLGEVMIAALPASLKLASETKVLLREDAKDRLEHLTTKELQIFDALELRKVLSLAEIADIIGLKTVYPIVKSMLEKSVVAVEEEVKEKYRPKTEEYVRIAEAFRNEASLNAVMSDLGRAPKQMDLLMGYLRWCNGKFEEGTWHKKLTLQEQTETTSAVTAQLVKKGVLESGLFEIDRLPSAHHKIEGRKELSAIQQKATEEIREGFKQHEVVLLHGVTSSGKTEIYCELIDEMIASGKRVLYLLPEIALTTQLITRLQKRFGDQVGVYHSRFNPQERAEVWHKLLNEERYQVIIGARSTVFLPFSNLGMIIIDEEHETSFKQYDPAPRYHARDLAMVLSNFHKAKVLLGSATPSVESYWQAKQGKYGLVELFTRHGEVQLPEIQVADVKKETYQKTMQANFSSLLIQNMEEAFSNKEQIILFQNRRGYSPRWQCETCGWTPMCVQCDISLTYHKSKHILSCHYCGHQESPPKKCGACGSSALKMVGFGTEKIEDDLAGIFPEKRIFRMDYDTTRSKNSYSQIINDFENGNIDVLVGTQMVTKGLDFKNVGLVGVMDASQLLYFPDFRAYERAFQLMAQVSGRAGRNKKRGKVIVQAHQPEHWVILKVIDNDYVGMYETEIKERKEFNYPPFFRLIKVTVRHVDKGLTESAANELAAWMKFAFGEMVIGPEYPSVERIRNQYNLNIMLKFSRELSQQKIKTRLMELVEDLHAQSKYRPVRVVIDVDPA